MALTTMAEAMAMQAAKLNSQPQQASNINFSLLTPTEAREQGISWKKEPPKNNKCKFCGAVLEPKGVVMGGCVIIWQPMPTRCTCKEAAAYWAEYDRKQAELKAAQEEQERRKIMQDRINRLISDSGLKKRFMQRTFENFRCDTEGRKRSYSIAKGYADNFSTYQKSGTGLYIEGTNGTGKTHLAAAVALHLLKRGVPVICKTGNDLFIDIKRTFESSEAQEYQVLDIYKKVDLLIIDDLGKEQCTDWSMSTLYNILNDRYEDMKPTIITTNYSVDGLINALTPRGYDNTKIIAIVSRLKETSIPLTMTWKDAREG